jgi:hypothetical protein
MNNEDTDKFIRRFRASAAQVNAQLKKHDKSLKRLIKKYTRKAIKRWYKSRDTK